MNNLLEMDTNGSGHGLYQAIIPASAWSTKENMKNSD
jgi:hypothetical protein